LEIIESPPRVSAENGIAWAAIEENPSPMAIASEATLRIAFSFLFVIGDAVRRRHEQPKPKSLNRT
jgi:hypothetical protein